MLRIFEYQHMLLLYKIEMKSKIPPKYRIVIALCGYVCALRVRGCGRFGQHARKNNFYQF